MSEGKQVLKKKKKKRLVPKKDDLIVNCFNIYQVHTSNLGYIYMVIGGSCGKISVISMQASKSLGSQK